MSNQSAHIKYGFKVAEEIGLVEARTLFTIFYFSAVKTFLGLEDGLDIESEEVNKVNEQLTQLMAYLYELYEVRGICSKEQAHEYITVFLTLAISEDNPAKVMQEVLKELVLAGIKEKN